MRSKESCLIRINCVPDIRRRSDDSRKHCIVHVGRSLQRILISCINGTIRGGKAEFLKAGRDARHAASFLEQPAVSKALADATLPQPFEPLKSMRSSIRIRTLSILAISSTGV